MTWKDKHNIILKNKKDIIKRYNENIPIKEIAGLYKVTAGCINKNLRVWGMRKRHGIRYLLNKMILEL